MFRCVILGAGLSLLLGCSPVETPTTTGSATGSGTVNGSLLSETWEAIFLNDTKVGYQHTVWKKDQAKSQVLITSEQRIELRRGLDMSTVQQSLKTTETTDGRLLTFSMETKAGAGPVMVSGEVVDKSLVVTTPEGDRERRSSLPWTDSIGGLFATQRLLVETPMKPGESRTQQLLMPGLGSVDVVEQRLEALKREATMVLQTSRELLKIRMVLDVGDTKIETFLWCDDDGQILKQHIPASRTLIVRVSKEIALGENDESMDLASMSIVRVKTPIRRPHATAWAQYRVTLKDSDPSKVFPVGLSQAVERRDAHGADITVQAVSPNRPAPPLVLAPQPPTKEELAPNQLIQSDDPRVIKIAKEVDSQEEGAWKLAVALEKHVNRIMKRATYSQAFESAATVARDLTGDCTEHAVLLAAVCRARGLPARVVTGLVYSEAHRGFAYHMWTEVWIEDRWIPLDATLGQGGIGAAHLKLADSSLAGRSEFNAFLPVSQVLWQLEVEVIGFR